MNLCLLFFFNCLVRCSVYYKRRSKRVNYCALYKQGKRGKNTSKKKDHS